MLELFEHVQRHILHMEYAHTPSTHKKQKPCHTPKNSTDLGAGEAGLSEDQVLHKPAAALSHKGFSPYIHRNGDLWIYFS